VNGLLVKEATGEELSSAIRAAARGQMMLAPEIAYRLVDWFRRSGNHADELLRPVLAELTPRERQILLLIADSMTTEEVAGRLAIGVTTVRTHLHRLRIKLKARDRAQLVSFAYRAGLMSSPNTSGIGRRGTAAAMPGTAQVSTEDPCPSRTETAPPVRMVPGGFNPRLNTRPPAALTSKA
jgi:DNA-binding CsgD family transcriptional regulator